ncbi:MAG TPA: alkaline phosphatase family protein [Stellaceae bacterium]|nr:alkaline phosphatase family protein [Stellaceae bacterium]
MRRSKTLGGAGAALLLAGGLPAIGLAEPEWSGHRDHDRRIDHVLLISIDGMHAVDFANCSAGSTPTCPNLAALAKTGTTYNQASTSRPSDSFPGLTALVTGASPYSTGAFYDVSYDRALAPPQTTTPYGIPGGSCTPNTAGPGTQIGNDEEIDIDLTKIYSGGQFAWVKGQKPFINPAYLPRDPMNGCAPVYPHSFVRVNSIFNVVKEAGGWTAWSDKHQSYELGNGPNGKGIDDFFSPEINSIPVGLTDLTRVLPPTISSCNPLPDQTAVTSSNAWTDSFQNVQCYDALKVQAILNEIDGKSHDGATTTHVPAVFGMNFQAVSVGQKLVESSLATPVTGGYADALGTPSPALLGQIEFVDAMIGAMVAELNARHKADSTLIIVTAKHGQSPIDLSRLVRIPADNASFEPPSQVLSPAGIGTAGEAGGCGSSNCPIVQALEDDISLLWLNDETQTTADVATLQANLANTGGGEILAGAQLDLLFGTTAQNTRRPDIIVLPNVGTVYTGHQAKVSEHGGFANDDTRVMLLLSNPAMRARTIETPVQTAQVAPTVLAALGLDPGELDAVRIEKTRPLPDDDRR